MSDSNSTERRPVGRPTIDDHDIVITLVNARLKQGRNLTQATKGGMVVGREYMDDRGKVSWKVEREITGATLRRRNSEARGPIDDEWARVRSVFDRPGTRLIGIFDPRSVSFCEIQPPPRGRPKER